MTTSSYIAGTLGPAGIVGLVALLTGITLRVAAVVDDAHRLRLPDDDERANGLRGAYIATRLGAMLTAIGATSLALDWIGEGGSIIALLAAPPALVLFDLIPRALAGESPSGARWTAALGRSLRATEDLLGGGSAPGWTHDGLTGLVRLAAPDEDTTERQMAARVYDFGDAAVGDIMVPLVDVIAVRDDALTTEVVRVARQERYSRLPVFHERLPNVIGILHVFDLLVPNEARTAADIMKPATFVPETAPASDVLRRLQVEGVNLSIVVDEYGGAVGIIAIEDILEEVVGEIEDEYDEEDDPVRETRPGTWTVDGRAEIERLNERFAWQLPEGNYETLAGLVLAHLAHVPEAGETVALENVTLRVSHASSRAVDEIVVTTVASPEEDSNS